MYKPKKRYKGKIIHSLNDINKELLEQIEKDCKPFLDKYFEKI